ncbi:MAG: hypothetical protein INR71_04030 [Terriglobus roseus]|nr:hypothetical protein [Terriglobus roseus]
MGDSAPPSPQAHDPHILPEPRRPPPVRFHPYHPIRPRDQGIAEPDPRSAQPNAETSSERSPPPFSLSDPSAFDDASDALSTHSGSLSYHFDASESSTPLQEVDFDFEWFGDLQEKPLPRARKALPSLQRFFFSAFVVVTALHLFYSFAFGGRLSPFNCLAAHHPDCRTPILELLDLSNPPSRIQLPVVSGLGPSSIGSRSSEATPEPVSSCRNLPYEIYISLRYAEIRNSGTVIALQVCRRSGSECVVQGQYGEKARRRPPGR